MMDLKTNGAIQEEKYATPEYFNRMRHRDLHTVIAAMLVEVPKGDKLAPMLDGVAKGHALFGCPETELTGWSSVIAAMSQRIGMLGDQPLPEWFLKVAAIFRGAE